MTISSTLVGTVSSQKKWKKSFMRTVIHHGLFALGVAVYGKAGGRCSARRVEVATWLQSSAHTLAGECGEP